MLRHVTGTRFLSGRRICGPHLEAEIIQHAKEDIVLRLFEEHCITSSLAARLLGVNRRQWIALLQQRGIALLDYSYDDLQEDMRVLDRLAQYGATSEDDRRFK
jgi:predicted HTH domain antitoxin